jgi:hypothetical protein
MSGTPTQVGSTSFDYQIALTNGLSKTYTATLVVDRRLPTIALTSAKSPADKSVPLQLNAAVAGYFATGTVQFFDGSTLVGTLTIASGNTAVQADKTIFSKAVTLAGGFRSLTAEYSGDSMNQPSKSAVFVQMMNPDATAQLLPLLNMLLDD